MILTNPETTVYGSTYTFNSATAGTVIGAQPSDDITVTWSSTGDPAGENVGSYPIVASVTGNNLSNYVIINPGNFLTVTKASLAIAPTSVTGKTYGTSVTPAGVVSGTSAALTQMAADGITVSYASTGALATANVGTYTETASLSDPQNKLSNYNVSKSTGFVTVSTAPLTVVANSATKVYGSTASLSGTITGAVNGDSFTDSYSSAGALATAGVGSYTITPSVTGSKLSNYTVTMTSAPLTVTKANLVLVTNPVTKVYGSVYTFDPATAGTLSGAANGDGFAVTYSSSGAAASAPSGTYPITAAISGTNLRDYNVTNAGNTLTVADPLMEAGTNPAGETVVPLGTVNPRIYYVGISGGATTAEKAGITAAMLTLDMELGRFGVVLRRAAPLMPRRSMST